MHKDTFRTWETDWGNGVQADFGDPVLENTILAKDRNVTGELRAGSWHHGPNVLGTSIFVNAASNFVQVFLLAFFQENSKKTTKKVNSLSTAKNLLKINSIPLP